MRVHKKTFAAPEVAPVIALKRGKKPVCFDYAAVFKNASEAIMVLTPRGDIQDLNTAAFKLLGIKKKDFESENLVHFDPETDIPPRTRNFNLEFLQTEGTYEDVVFQRKDSREVRVVDLSTRKLDENTCVVFLRDVTEKKNLDRELLLKHQELKSAYVELEKKNDELKATQAMLVQAGKLAALGELAAGIAHELNQPLMSIRGYSQEIQYHLSHLTVDPNTRTILDLSLREVIEGSDKMAKIIQSLRTFTRRSTEDFEIFPASRPIEEALKMVTRQLESRGIEVLRTYPQSEPQIYANALQLEQVFINLTTNARDAIEATHRGRGKIQIQISDIGKFVEVRFQDNGAGMNEKTISKVFNPFFTTKEVGKGMGLGLSLSYGMISKIHGSIRVESEEGRGTTFVIRIPKDFRELG